MTDMPMTLAGFGWGAFFHQQLTAEELASARPARVTAVHRGAVEVAAPGLTTRLPSPAAAVAVGDWLLLDPARDAIRRVLERRSLFSRKAAGTGHAVQPIAANVDTLFVVGGCDQDFNLARLERYLALAREAGVMPLVVLTKADLAADPAAQARSVARLMPGLLVEPLDARDPAAAARLRAWCAPGQTVALVGSSGVGKSTLVNSLSGAVRQDTGAVRADDGRGRHTTTARSLHLLPAGGWLLDTPGMRELQLADVAAGLDAVFAEIPALAAQCRFADCRHDSEPGCAVRAAVEAGRLDPARLARHAKLRAESARNAETLADAHARARRFGRMVKSVMAAKREREGR